MEKIQQAAEFSILRGSGFAGLGIGTVMIGLITHPEQSFESGGVLALTTSLVMVLRALFAHRTPYRRTEVWLLLPADDRPVASVAQQVIAEVRRTAYLQFAYYWACCAMVLLSTAIFWRLVMRF